MKSQNITENSGLMLTWFILNSFETIKLKVKGEKKNKKNVLAIYGKVL